MPKFLWYIFDQDKKSRLFKAGLLILGIAILACLLITAGLAYAPPIVAFAGFSLGVALGLILFITVALNLFSALRGYRHHPELWKALAHTREPQAKVNLVREIGAREDPQSRKLAGTGMKLAKIILLVWLVLVLLFAVYYWVRLRA